MTEVHAGVAVVVNGKLLAVELELSIYNHNIDPVLFGFLRAKAHNAILLSSLRNHRKNSSRGAYLIFQ